MFKKTVLFGILLVALVVLSGCGQISYPCTESATSHCYGITESAGANGYGYVLTIPKANADGTCPTEGYENKKNINGLCYAVGDASACSSLNTWTANDLKLSWTSTLVPQYNVNLCSPTCTSVSDCGGNEAGANAICYTVDSANKFCAPRCNSDKECLPGLSHCELITKYGKNYCVPNTGLAVELAKSVESPKSGTFFINIYITPRTNTLASVNIALQRIGNSVEFDSVIYDGEFYPSLGKSFSYDYVTDTGGYSIKFNNPVNVVPGQRYLLASVEAKVVGTGPSTIILQEQASSAVSTSPADNYPVKAKTKEAGTINVCVPKTTANCETPLACGTLPMDDGCGGKVVCTSQTPTCAEGSVCQDNACVLAVSQVLPVAALPKDKDLLTSVSDVLKKTPCNSSDVVCKAGRIDAILTALITWFNQ